MSSPAARARSNSLKQGLEHVPNQLHAVSHPSPPSKPASSKGVPLLPAASFINDIKSFRWMTNPETSAKIIVAILALWGALELLPAVSKNPLTPLLLISHPLPLLPTDNTTRYEKGLLDFAFLGFYIIVFSFIRQAVTEFMIRPFARWAGLNTDAKQTRFMEQAYAIIYNVISGGLGLWVMWNGDSWWYQTKHYWVDFPNHWRMSAPLKYYYLLQCAYWLQQMIVLSLRLEKPRSDYYQLIIHHVVTIWLIGWSYTINLTQIGVAVYVSMDIPEIFLASSKCLNYLGFQHCSEVSFVALLAVWTYMRHYLNCQILWSVWNEFELIPIWNRTWQASVEHPHAWWLWRGLETGRVPAWLQYQIFAPIFLLQCVNGFWSYLLWRILWRLVVGVKIADIREEGETDEEEVEETKKDK